MSHYLRPTQSLCLPCALCCYPIFGRLSSLGLSTFSSISTCPLIGLRRRDVGLPYRPTTSRPHFRPRRNRIPHTMLRPGHQRRTWRNLESPRAMILPRMQWMIMYYKLSLGSRLPKIMSKGTFHSCTVKLSACSTRSLRAVSGNLEHPQVLHLPPNYSRHRGERLYSYAAVTMQILILLSISPLAYAHVYSRGNPDSPLKNS